MTTCEPLRLERNSIFESTFLYKDSYRVPVDLTGLVNDADFTISDDQGVDLWVGSVTSGEITPLYDEGRFELLISELVIDEFDFNRAKYRFRIKWISKGWQSLGDGDVIFDD